MLHLRVVSTICTTECHTFGALSLHLGQALAVTTVLNTSLEVLVASAIFEKKKRVHL